MSTAKAMRFVESKQMEEVVKMEEIEEERRQQHVMTSKEPLPPPFEIEGDQHKATKRRIYGCFPPCRAKDEVRATQKLIDMRSQAYCDI